MPRSHWNRRDLELGFEGSEGLYFLILASWRIAPSKGRPGAKSSQLDTSSHELRTGSHTICACLIPNLRDKLAGSAPERIGRTLRLIDDESDFRMTATRLEFIAICRKQGNVSSEPNVIGLVE